MKSTLIPCITNYAFSDDLQPATRLHTAMRAVQLPLNRWNSLFHDCVELLVGLNSFPGSLSFFRWLLPWIPNIERPVFLHRWSDFNPEHAHRGACQPVCLFVFLSVCFSVCLSVCLSGWFVGWLASSLG